MLDLNTIGVLIAILVGIIAILSYFGIHPKFKKCTITITNHVHEDRVLGIEIFNTNGESLHITNISIGDKIANVRYPLEILAYKKGESINWGIYRGLETRIEEGSTNENDELIIEDVQGKKFVKKVSELLELRNGKIKALIIKEK